MKYLVLMTISLLMSAPAFAGSNGDCGNGDHGDRVGTRDRVQVTSRALNPGTTTRKPKKIKGRQ